MSNNRYNQRNQSKSSDTPTKKSGCTMDQVKDDNGNPYKIMYGWNASKQGLMKFIAAKKKSVNSKGEKQANECSTKDGEVREIWVCKVTFPSKIKQLYTGFYDPIKKVLRIPDLEMTANPNTPVGITSGGKKVSGYFGRNFKK